MTCIIISRITVVLETAIFTYIEVDTDQEKSNKNDETRSDKIRKQQETEF